MNIHYGISQAFHNKALKPGYSAAAFGDSFQPDTDSCDALFSHILNGVAFTVGYFQGNTRKNETFISAQLIAVDLDDNVSVADAMANPFIRQYAALVYPTPTSCVVTEKNPSGGHRTRVLFILSEPVETVEQFRALARAVCEHIGLNADESSYKPAQFFFGSTSRVEQPYISSGAVLPLAVAGALTVDQATAEYAKEQQRRERQNRPTAPVTEAWADACSARAWRMVDTLAATSTERNNAIYKTAFALFVKAVSNEWPGLDEASVQTALEGVVSAWPNARKSLGTIARARAAAASQPEPLPKPPANEPRTKIIIFNHDNADATGFQWGQGGLPDDWREAFLNFYPHFAPFAELINDALRNGLIDAEHVTMSGLLKASQAMNKGFTQSTLYNMKDTIKSVFFQELHTCSEYSAVEIVGKTPNGRPSTAYRITPFADVLAHLEACAAPRLIEREHPTEPTPNGKRPILARVTPAMMHDHGYQDADAQANADAMNALLTPAYEAQGNAQDRAAHKAQQALMRLKNTRNTYSTPLPEGWPIGSVAAYRAAYEKALNTENPQMSQKEIAARLGVHERSVQSVLARAGLKNVEQFVEQRIEAAPDAAQRHIQSLGYELRGYPVKLESRIDGRLMAAEPYRAENVRAFVQNARAYGAEVIARYQVASRQEVVRDTPPEPKARPVADEPRDTRTTTPDGEGEDMQQTADKAFYGPHYNPAWLAGQWRLAMRLLGWQEQGGYIYTPDGEQIANDASADELVSILLDYARPDAPPDDELPAFIVAAIEMGATVTRRGVRV